jgi:AraC family transcriptional regulator, regulatory protein of adaptative response / methylated-DNA-[protein]-cysteine methyltransferase
MPLRIFGTDDAKERKMPEVIRFAWGNSSLGEFMVAMSDKGLVALELGSRRDSAEEALRIRLPGAEVVSRQLELIDILDKITRVMEEPRFDPELPLDMRGTAYEPRSGRCYVCYPSTRRSATARSRPNLARATPAT